MKKKISIALVCIFCMAVEVTKADFVFGTPTKLGPNINTSSEEFNASISADGLSLYFISNRSGGVGMRDIWVATRQTTDEDWGEPVNLGPIINTPAGEWGVSISYDGLSLYFDTSQSGSLAVDDLWVASRATTDDDWSNPVSLGPTINSSGDDYSPSISSDGLALYFMSSRSGGYGNYDLWVTTRATTDEDWGAPVNLGPTVNSSVYDIDPGISPDGRMLFFTRTTAGTEANIWMTWRATTNDEWSEPVNLGPTINSSAFERYPNISADGSTLFFRYSQSDFRVGGDIYQAPIIPIVDFNADGTVDALDLSIMVDHWGTNETLCDIGPMPWGDGIVDVRDLLVLANYLEPETKLPDPIAHWPLDETEGFATDVVGNNIGYVLGGAVWEPAGGQIGGAIRLDGVDGCIMANPVLDPAEGPFSVLAWVQGGAPGQVIVSGTSGCNWLMLDAEGKLMTELNAPDPSGTPLLSEAVIGDGLWHHIGLVWDGSNRMIYVDGVSAAADTQDSLEGSFYGFRIGTGENMEPGTYFAGLVDDVRIYDRALSDRRIATLAQ